MFPGSLTVLVSTAFIGRILKVLVAVSLRNPGIIFTVLGLLQNSKVFEPEREVTGFVLIGEVLLVVIVSLVILCTGAIC